MAYRFLYALTWLSMSIKSLLLSLTEKREGQRAQDKAVAFLWSRLRKVFLIRTIMTSWRRDRERRIFQWIPGEFDL